VQKLVVTFVLLVAGTAALAEQPREVKTAPGTPVALTFLLNQTADCNVGPVGLPVLTEKPVHGPNAHGSF
jgi:hypothetical protein